MTRTQRLRFAAAAIAAAAMLVPGPAAAKDKDPEKPAPATTVVASDYKMGAGDKLRIEVYKDPQLSQSVQIRPDGKISLLLVGDIAAAGSTPIELRDTLTEKLKEYMTNPVVMVMVTEASAAIAYVVGEVNHPGAVTLQGGQLTVLQALAITGGLKDFADSKNIRIIRHADSAVQTIGFNYKAAIRGGAPVYLKPGDTVVVPD
jgi:polysaccharide export outer membrane protein